MNYKIIKNIMSVSVKEIINKFVNDLKEMKEVSKRLK